MADQSDVENALVAVISAALYPDGPDAASTVGLPCRVYRGWPSAAALEADLAARRVNVTVFPDEHAMRNTTRYPGEWQAGRVPPTLTVDAGVESATFGGSAAPGQLAGLLVDGNAYVHRTAAGDTPALVAAVLAEAVRADRIALLSGSTVTVPGAASLIARVVADAPSVLELRRQEQRFRITAWCPAPEARDRVCGLLDVALSSARFIALPDGSAGRHRWIRSATFDQGQAAALYRRDLIYAVDYPTTASATQPTMLFGSLALAGQNRFA